MKKFYAFVRGFLYVPYKLVFPVKVVGRENMPQTARLISVSNHLSALDIPTVAIYVPGYRHFIAKKEISENKFINKLGLGLGVIFIDREKTDLSSLRECINLLKAGEGLAIFPEGTRNKVNTDLQEIKPGVTLLAVKGASPIVPIMVHGKTKAFKKNYVYIGEPFDLKEFESKRLDTDTLKAASQKVYNHMKAAKDYLDDYVLNKRWIEIKKQTKQRNKILKEQNSQAKKDYKKFLKNVD